MTDELEKQILHELREYCKSNIEDYEERESRALDNIDRNRCPLFMVDGSLDTAITDAINDWLMENFDTDDIIFAE